MNRPAVLIHAGNQEPRPPLRTCAACGHHVIDRETRADFKCRMNVEGYPNRTDEDCTTWIKRYRSLPY